MARVKVNLDKLKKALPSARLGFNADVKATLGAEIDKQISKGVSPVQGQARYGDYKPSYKASIKAGYQGTVKRVRPVNLTVTGDLRKSQKLKADKDKISVAYTDEKAKWHNEGTAKMVRRPLLPTVPGEVFSRVITKFLLDKAKKVLTQFL